MVPIKNIQSSRYFEILRTSVTTMSVCNLDVTINYVIFILLYLIFYTSSATIERNTTKEFHPRNLSRNFLTVTSENGFHSEEHTVINEDGYMLTIFRINKSKNCSLNEKKTPILFMHGLLQNANSWIDSGPDSGLAYLLSNACYDVWIGNFRGNFYARRHISLNPDVNGEYWNFYIDDHGRYDLPAIIDYILTQTGEEKIVYIGFSLGAGAFFIMCSERPDYCEKVKLLICLAPGTRMRNLKSVSLRTSLQAIGRIEEISGIGMQEMLPKGGLIQTLSRTFCQNDLFVKTCELFLNEMDHVSSHHSGSISKDTIKVLFHHLPSGTSIKSLVWHYQSLKSGNFEKYSYGKEKNLELYGREVPPGYNLSAVSVPVLCIYGKNDGLVDVKDVEWLVSQLPNVVEAFMVKDPLWSHFDVNYSKNTRSSLLPKINEYLLKYA